MTLISQALAGGGGSAIFPGLAGTFWGGNIPAALIGVVVVAALASIYFLRRKP